MCTGVLGVYNFYSSYSSHIPKHMLIYKFLDYQKLLPLINEVVSDDLIITMLKGYDYDII